jgi:prepilin-type N-terminal cleavage/methylation domain-containing protein
MRTSRSDAGFSLIETIVAMGILATGLLGLAGIFTVGMAHMSTSSANLVAREKAREAVESVHTARDTRTISWCQIYNVTPASRSAECSTTPPVPGVFLDGPQDLKDPGPDGLVNTTDDLNIEEQRLPGPDGILGNSDDVHIPLTNFKRTILISDLLQDDGSGINQDLRKITVTITYNVGPAKRSYTLTTYISRIS